MSTLEAKTTPFTPLQKAAFAVKEMRARLDKVESAKQEPIAIIGMACRFPSADGVEEYWRLLSEGINAIGEVPKERWDLEKYFDKNPSAPGKINTRYGGFIDDIDQFDASFFGISPMEAERLDPQHRLLLEMTWHALEDAGQAPSGLKGSSCGVFVGIAQNDYGVRQLAGPEEDILAYTGTGNGFCFAAGRLAYTLGLNGPTFSVDTACSSSLVALHQAAQAIRHGECDTAIVAGVQLNITPPMQLFLSKTQSFSPQGRCSTFDESANGFVLGEGAGVLVLRKESLAIKRSDRIHALIKGTGINHDGASSGLTVPNESAQESLVREVINRSKLKPDCIDYIEAHGTATELGDPIELGALRSVFGLREGGEPLYVGSVKTNIGHLGAAAGIAGLIKTVLMLTHETVAPNLHYSQPSSRISWDRFSVRVPNSEVPWPRQNRVRRAGISSFGLSGTNAHILIEEAPLKKPVVELDVDRPQHLLTLSAHDRPALLALVKSYHEIDPSFCLADIAHGANTGRSHLAQRLIIKASNRAELNCALQSVLEDKLHPEVLIDRVAKGGAGRLAINFCESFPVEHTNNLAQYEPRIEQSIRQCEKIYTQLKLNERQRADAEVLTAQWAIVAWLKDCGVNPDAVSGQGIGLLLAQCVAGMFDLSSVFLLLSGGSVKALSPQIKVFRCTDENTLEAFPFTDIEDYYFRNKEHVQNKAEKEISHEILERGLMDSGYGCSLFLGASQGVFVAKGLQNSGQNPSQKNAHTTTHVDSSNVNLWSNLLASLAAIYVRGFDVNWRGYDAPYKRNWVTLPRYLFQRKRHWLEVVERGADVGNLSEEISSDPSLEKKATEAQEIEAQEIEIQDIETLDIDHSLTSVESAVSVDAATIEHQSPEIPVVNSQLAVLLRKQLQSASSAINDVVGQQLEFLKTNLQPSFVEQAVDLDSEPSAANDSVSATSTTITPTPTITPTLTPTPQLQKEQANDLSNSLGAWNLLKIKADNENQTLELIQHWHQKSADSSAQASNNPSVSNNIGKGRGKSILVYDHLDNAADACGLIPKGEQSAVINRKRLISNFDPMDRSMVFMFPGVGDHYLNMAQGLYQYEPVFRKEFDYCCDLIKNITQVDLRQVVYPPKSVSASNVGEAKKVAKPGLDLRAMLGRGSAPVDPAESLLNKSIHSQPLVFIVEYALAKVWQSKGLQPNAMIGYSIGEYTAACLAGVIGLEDVLRLVTERAALIQTMPSGVLLAVPMSEQRLTPLLNDQLSLSIVSTVNQCVVGGPELAIADLEQRLSQLEIVSRRLPGTHAYHSKMLAPLHQGIKALVSGFPLQPPKIPYISNVTGTWIEDHEATSADYWAQHTWRTVRFSDGLDLLLRTDQQIFLEVGPGQSLGSFVLQHPGGQQSQHKVVLPSLRNRHEAQGDEAFFLSTLGKLWLAGAEGLLI